MSDIQSTIVDAFEQRAEITPRNVSTPVRDATMEAIEQLDRGEIRVAEKRDGNWVVHDWVKKAVLLSFRINDNDFIKGGFTNYYDKVESIHAPSARGGCVWCRQRRRVRAVTSPRAAY